MLKELYYFLNERSFYNKTSKINYTTFLDGLEGHRVKTKKVGSVEHL
jgi:hypothetical protein